MSRSEYLLTSSHEAAELAEQCRRSLLAAAVDDIRASLEDTLPELLHAMREDDFDERTQNDILSHTTSLASSALRHVKTACIAGSVSQPAYVLIRKMAAVQDILELGSPQHQTWETIVRVMMAKLEDARNGTALAVLTHLYEATDPALPEAYRNELIAELT